MGFTSLKSTVKSKVKSKVLRKSNASCILRHVPLISRVSHTGNFLYSVVIIIAKGMANSFQHRPFRFSCHAIRRMRGRSWFAIFLFSCAYWTLTISSQKRRTFLFCFWISTPYTEITQLMNSSVFGKVQCQLHDTTPYSTSVNPQCLST